MKPETSRGGGSGSRLAFLRRQRVPVDQMRIDRPAAEAALAVGYALFFILASVGTGLVIARWPAPFLGAASFTQDVWYAFGFKMTLLLAVPAAWLRWRGYRPGDFLAGWRPTPGALARVALAFLAGLALNVHHIEPLRHAWGAAPPGPGRWVRALCGVLLPLLSAGLPEEIVYRGVLQTRLEAVAGRPAAIGLTVLLFTAWHLPTRFLLSHGVEGTAGDLPSVLLGTGLPVLIVGLIFGLAWDRWRNLPALVAMHWGIDTLPALTSLFGLVW
ncbi:MAG TPA: CPBP family intramembrane glutamic endopeptidase [Candidatus Polarisedimenticolia bacterium]|nr:CPBP family intramembrane glutamic endopeptidase [Candidatus Polarisedimenticolia bacterium]